MCKKAVTASLHNEILAAEKDARELREAMAMVRKVCADVRQDVLNEVAKIFAAYNTRDEKAVIDAMARISENLSKLPK